MFKVMIAMLKKSNEATPNNASFKWKFEQWEIKIVSKFATAIRFGGSGEKSPGMDIEKKNFQLSNLS